jgi:transposase-like protein
MHWQRGTVAFAWGLSAARQFFARALPAGPSPVQVSTDRALVYPRVVDDLVAAARQVTEQYANNVIEADHGRLKSRLSTRRTDGTRHRERRLPEGDPAGRSQRRR